MFSHSKPADAIEKYVAYAWIQHNRGEPEGKQAFIAYFERMAREYPASGLSSNA